MQNVILIDNPHRKTNGRITKGRNLSILLCSR